jgi:hypothetical protein
MAKKNINAQSIVRAVMGYRSDVAYTIRFKKEEDYHLFILEAKSNPETAGCFPPNYGSHFRECELDDKRFRIDFKNESVKWYDSYPAVQMHEKLIAQAEEWCHDDTHKELRFGGTGHDAYRLGFVFVRVGEDGDDNERREGGNNAYDWLHIRREIIEE